VPPPLFNTGQLNSNVPLASRKSYAGNTPVICASPVLSSELTLLVAALNAAWDLRNVAKNVRWRHLKPRWRFTRWNHAL